MSLTVGSGTPMIGEVDPFTTIAAGSALAVLAALSLIVGLAVAWLRRPTEGELKAIREVSAAVRMRADKDLNRLARLESEGVVLLAANDAADSIRDELREYESAVRAGLEEHVDNDLFKAALRARLPGQQGKLDFQLALASVHERVLAPEKLQRRLEAIVANRTDELLREVDEADPMTTSPEVREALAVLNTRPRRYERFIGGPSIEPLLQLRVERDLGLLAAGSGVATFGFANLLPAEDFAWAAGKLMNLKWGGAEGLVSWVGDLIIAAVGEELAGDMLEKLGLLVAGAGLVFAGYKAFKIGRLAKRFLYDREHLVQMRSQLADAWIPQIHELQGTAPQRAGESIANEVARCRLVLEAVREHADKQFVWADRRLPRAA